MNTLRKASLPDLSEFLRTQREQVLDFVAPANQLEFDGGHLVATVPDRGREYFTLTDHAKGQIAEKLGIPLPYYRRMESDNTALLDSNVNGWLHNGDESRSFLVRGMMNGGATARAFLSDRFLAMDNYDVLAAALGKLEGADLQVESADVTETRMFVRLFSPTLAENAMELVHNYRFNWGGTDQGGLLDQNHQRTGTDYPLVFAGFVLSNSEVGAGAFSITPRLVLQVCLNGLLVNVDVMRRAHLGGRLDEGSVNWSGETRRRNLQLISSQTADAVGTFMSRDYVRSWVKNQERAANTGAFDGGRTIEDVKLIAAEHGVLQTEADAILARFIQAGDHSAFGVGQALTSFAQTVESGDRAHELEAAAPRLVAALTK